MRVKSGVFVRFLALAMFNLKHHYTVCPLLGFDSFQMLLLAFLNASYSEVHINDYVWFKANQREDDLKAF